MTKSHVLSVIRPASLEEAWSIKKDSGNAACFLGGGIDLALFTPAAVTEWIDLGGLGLAGVRSDSSGLRIGAMTTLTDVLESPEVEKYLGGFLTAVFRQVASPLQRSMATLGGSIARGHSWSDIIPALLVLDAQILVYDGEERSLPLIDVLDRRQDMKPLLLGVLLPSQPDGAAAAFVKYAQTGFDVAALNCATYASSTAGVWGDVRIAVGATPALARRLPDVEERLTGKSIERGGIDAAASAAGATIDARDDLRASAGYRRTLAESGLRNCLNEMAGEAEGSAS